MEVFIVLRLQPVQKPIFVGLFFKENDAKACAYDCSDATEVLKRTVRDGYDYKFWLE